MKKLVNVFAVLKNHFLNIQTTATQKRKYNITKIKKKSYYFKNAYFVYVILSTFEDASTQRYSEYYFLLLQ